MNPERAEVLKHEYWDEVCGEIDKLIGSTVNMLITCKPEQLSGLQERIGAFEQVKGLLDQILEERTPNEREGLNA